MKNEYLQTAVVVLSSVVALQLLFQLFFYIKIKQYFGAQLDVNEAFLNAFDEQDKLNTDNLNFKNSQKNFNRIHFKDTLIFTRYNRIPVIDLIIDDCIKHEQYKIAEYWKKERERYLKQAKGEF